MVRLSVFVWILVVTTTHLCGGSLLKSCQELCCFASWNKTVFDLNFEKGNNDTTNCQECMKNHTSDANLTLQQLCPKQQINRTNTNQGIDISSCQEMYDKASNDFAGLVQGVKVNFHRFGNFWCINITWDAFNDPKMSKNWSHYVIQWFTTSPQHTHCSLLPKNRTFFVINETEDGWKHPQEIHLNVSTYPLKKNTGYRYEITGWPQSLQGISNKPVTLPKKVSPEMVAAIIVGSSAGLILVTMVIVAWKLRYPEGWRAKSHRSRMKSLSENQGNFEYDASILYSSFDEQWVTEELIPLLESENNFKCFIHFRDYEAGKVIHENMADSVYNCRKNLAVVSKNFLKSSYCKTELDMALERVNRCGDYSLIVVNLDGVSIDLLPKALRIRTFVNLTSSQEQKTWRNRLVKQISVEEDRQLGSKVKAEELLHVTSGGCQVISHINDISSSSTESV